MFGAIGITAVECVRERLGRRADRLSEAAILTATRKFAFAASGFAQREMQPGMSTISTQQSVPALCG
jgi:hypothetical protein